MRGTRRSPGRRARTWCAAAAAAFAFLASACLGTAAPGLTAAHAARASQPRVPPLYLGLQSYLHLGDLSYLEIGDRVEAETAADPGGGDDVIHERTLFHQYGPGVITSMRMQQGRGSPWRLSVDGGGFDFATSDLGGSDKIFPYPLALGPNQTRGSSMVFTPFSFSSQIDLTATARNANFDGIWRKLPYGAALPAATATAAAHADIVSVGNLLRSAGTDIAPPGLPSQAGTARLGTAGTPLTLTTITGADQIRALSIRVPLADAVQFGNSTLEIYWDGQATPAVSAPLKFLAGDGAGVYTPKSRPLVRGLLASITSDRKTYLSYNLYYPMPLRTSARIVLVPNAASAGLGPFRWSVTYQPFRVPSTWWGYFHANYVTVEHPKFRYDMTFLNYAGSGKLVGTVVNFGTIGTALEGNPQIFLDNSLTPQIPYTGSEEWGLGGDYWDGGKQTSLPLGGLPSSTNNPPGTDVEGAAFYRFLIADSIPFNSRIVVDWQHGGLDNWTGPFSASMMWYGTPHQTAIRSDDVLIADPASVAAHHFVSPGRLLVPLTAAFEYLPREPLITGTVAETKTYAQFVMRLYHDNAGAFLRRTFDSCVAGQAAKVYVDGRFAGTWFDQGFSPGRGFDGHERCWRQEDFPLPASMTAGRSTVTIKLVRSGFGPYWTASEYRMFSFVP